MMINEYSDNWYQLFMDSIDESQTRREVEFLSRQLPLPQYRRVLDVCCGSGRHAVMLVDLGYELTGIDINDRPVAKANERLAGRARILQHDMRELDRIDQDFDAVLLLWQSFGQFDEQTNRDIVQSIWNKLAPPGDSSSISTTELSSGIGRARETTRSSAG